MANEALPVIDPDNPNVAILADGRLAEVHYHLPPLPFPIAGAAMATIPLGVVEFTVRP